MLKTVSTANGLVSPTFSGNVTLTDGNLIIGTSGKGIDFSATPGTGTSELLADYEEGTWTPTFTGWTIAPTVYNATYTKVGRQVTVAMYASNGVNNYAGIGGIPFAGSATSTGAGVIANRTDYISAGTCCVFTSGTTLDSFNVVLTAKFWQLTATYFV
jgi:hypothetical protein